MVAHGRVPRRAPEALSAAPPSERGVSIEDLQTEIVGAAAPEKHLFKVKALLVVPDALSNDSLRQTLQTLASEMMVDIALDERGNGH